jgi:hypothetical protein
MKTMNKNPDSGIAPTETKEIKHRLVVPIQTRGNLGKSTEAIARCEWMNKRGVDWRGFDLDHFNRTLSANYPQQVVPLPPDPEPEGEIIQILRKVTQAEVTLIDPAAHMNQTLLRAFETVRFTDLAAKAQARATVLVFPIDEISDMDDISLTVQTLGDSVDWVVVRNPVKIPTTRFFDGSRLEERLRSLGAAFFTLPTLMGITRRHLRACEARTGRSISPGEAIADSELKIDLLHRCLIEDWLKKAQLGFDSIASHLLPSTVAARIQSALPVAPQTSATRQRGEGLNFTEAA